MAQQDSQGSSNIMQTGGRRDAADPTLKERADAMAEQVQDGYGRAKERVADLAEDVGEAVAERGHRLREQLDEFEPGDAGRAVLRQAKGAPWSLLLIGGALGFGLAAWMGANEPRGAAAPRARRRRKG